jgi:crotonobetainyl-CoA:carnitine CoA-transferase CaiB-like acyl-CoA transferase
MAFDLPLFQRVQFLPRVLDHRDRCDFDVGKNLTLLFDGDVPRIRTPVKIDGSIRVRAVAPKLGQHNAEIFDRMRLSEQDIETLQAQRVV